jgi:hypothetical protein
VVNNNNNNYNNNNNNNNNDVEDKLPDALLERYLHDFVAMHVLNDEHYNVSMQDVVVPVVRHLLLLATGKPATHASDFHVRFWKHEQQVLRFLRWLHVLPPHKQAEVCRDVCSWMPATMVNVDAEVEMRCLHLVLQAMEALASANDNVAAITGITAITAIATISAAEWVEALSRMDEDVPGALEDLLARHDGTTALGCQASALWLRWEKLVLYGAFITSLV